MELPINAAIACADGPCGHSTAIILNPISDQVTHLVVREPRLLDTERMVPLEFMIESTTNGSHAPDPRAADRAVPVRRHAPGAAVDDHPPVPRL